MKIAAKMWTLMVLGFGALVALAPVSAAPLTVPISEGGQSVEEVTLYTNSYALVIGIDDYSSGWPRLNNAVKDARAVAAAMETRGFKVTLVENPTGSQLVTAIKEFFILKGEDPDARLFMWFAGHGFTENEEGFIIPKDGLAPEEGARFRLTAIPLRDINTYVRLAQSKHVYAVFDACFAGTIFDSARARPSAAITRASIKPVRQFLTSGDAFETVSDDGSFRELFLRALAGEEEADRNRDGFLTASELGYYMSERVTILTEGGQNPRYGKLRSIKYKQGDFIFALPGRQAPQQQDPVQTDTSERPSSLETDMKQANLRLEMELTFWQTIMSSQDPADFEDFILSFPNGTFTAMARRRLARLSGAPRIAEAQPSPSLPEPEAAAAPEPEEEIRIAAIDPQIAVTKPAPPVPSVLTGDAKAAADPSPPESAPEADPARAPEELSAVQNSMQEQFANYTPGTLLAITRRDPSLPELPPGDSVKTSPDDVPDESAADDAAASDPLGAIQKGFPDFVPGELEPIIFVSRSDTNTIKDTGPPEITTEPPPETTAAPGACVATEEAMRAPIDALFQSWEQLAIETYMSQWAADAIQYKLSGDSRDKATIRRVREGLFPLLSSVSVERTDMSLLDSGENYGRFENTYTMEFHYKTGRIVREENDLERYEVRCDTASGQWLIAENTDLPDN